jgi:outer membrane protein assembly factor BamB
MYLYIGSNGYVAALNPATGQEVWRTELQSGIFSATIASDVCVLEHEGCLFASSRGHVFALDGETGEILWHNDLKGMGHNDITMSIAGKNIQFTGSDRAAK